MKIHGISSIIVTFIVVCVAIACTTESPTNALNDASTNRACGEFNPCPGMYVVCLYKIGSCSAQGECFTQPMEPSCGTLEGYCDCKGDGQEVYSTCDYPVGYANGPTMGESAVGSFCDGYDAGARPPPTDGG